MRKNNSRLLIVLLIGVLGLVIVNRLQSLLPSNTQRALSPALPTPTPVISAFTDTNNTFAFYAPSSWITKTPENYDTQSTTEFVACNQTTLTIRRLANIDPQTNKRRTPYSYLDVPTDIPASTIDGLSALTVSEASPAAGMLPYSSVVIDATPSAELIELRYTPTCGMSLDEGKKSIFYPLLNSFAFTR